MSQAMDLAGSYLLHPGRPASIEGRRPVMGAGTLRRLLQGRQLAAVEPLLGQLFSLCGHAHRRCARLAFNAALPSPVPGPTPEPAVFLALETARDHLRSMVLDWPHRQAWRLTNANPSAQPPVHPLTWLRDCPLGLSHQPWSGTEDQAWQTLVRFRQWLEEHLLGRTAAQWLTQYRESEALAAWCQAQTGASPLIQTLAGWHALASALHLAAQPLDLLDADPQQQTSNLRELVQAMAADPHFAQTPSWRGQCAETGPWTRLAHRHSPAGEPSAWTRLSARWTELIDISAMEPDPATVPLLSSGALSLGDGQAIAWCEMARGLLLHWVQLDAQGRVLDYRVLAPTEWNFHPQGVLAQALTGLAPQDSASARTLAAAFDACVDCQVATDQPESGHA